MIYYSMTVSRFYACFLHVLHARFAVFCIFYYRIIRKRSMIYAPILLCSMQVTGDGTREQCNNGRQEKDDTLALTLAIGEILQDRGIDVEYTRTTDVYETPYQKAMEANEAGADFFISIHRNSYPTDNAVSGVESLVYDLSGIKLQWQKT